MKSFLTRLGSGIIIIAVMTIMNVFGGPVMAVILAAISLIGLYEFYKAVDVKTTDKSFNAFEIIGYLGTLSYCVVSYIFKSKYIYLLLLVIVCVLVLMLAVYVFSFPKYDGRIVMRAFFGFMYVPVMLQFIFLTREMKYGKFLVWLIYIASWVCDTCAYCVGILIGKHKMAPVLSPKKSIEGAIGGIVGSMIVAGIFSAIVVNNHVVEKETTWGFVVIGLIGAIVSQIGDLAASAFKRNYDIKDYGHLIPGHGGIMDRFDSVIFTAPMIYFLTRILINII